MKITTVGIYLAKNIFQIHGVNPRQRGRCEKTMVVRHAAQGELPRALTVFPASYRRFSAVGS